MNNDQTSELIEMVDAALSRHANASRNLAKELKAIQWRFRGPNGEHVGLGPVAQGSPFRFVPESKEQVFDGRDNEAIKRRVYELALGPLTVEIIPQITEAA